MIDTLPKSGSDSRLCDHHKWLHGLLTCPERTILLAYSSTEVNSCEKNHLEEMNLRDRQEFCDLGVVRYRYFLVQRSRSARSIVHCQVFRADQTVWSFPKADRYGLGVLGPEFSVILSRIDFSAKADCRRSSIWRRSVTTRFPTPLEPHYAPNGPRLSFLTTLLSESDIDESSTDYSMVVSHSRA